jgi:hypothetical protein
MRHWLLFWREGDLKLGLLLLLGHVIEFSLAYRVVYLGLRNVEPKRNRGVRKRGLDLPKG